jgi:hypothetical protein
MSEETKTVRRKRRLIRITGEIVPRGTLKPNLHHPCAELPEGKTRREAFIDALASALAELPRKYPMVRQTTTLAPPPHQHLNILQPEPAGATSDTKRGQLAS